MTTTFIIDDDPLAVSRLHRMLSRVGNIDIAGSSTDPASAIEEMSILRPDALFLDVEMPGLDAFEVIDLLAARACFPLVVLVTGFPRFAADAFDRGVVDFLNKPVEFGRLQACAERLREAVRAKAERKQLRELLSEERLSARRGSNVLWVNRRGAAISVDLDRLDRASAESEYVRLFVDGKDFLLRGSLTGLTGLVDPRYFVRIHRTHLVRTDRIAAVHRSTTGSYSVTLQSGDVLPVGRLYRQAVRLLCRTRPTEVLSELSYNRQI